jgi:hypothetical protein
MDRQKRINNKKTIPSRKETMHQIDSNNVEKSKKRDKKPVKIQENNVSRETLSKNRKVW